MGTTAANPWREICLCPVRLCRGSQEATGVVSFDQGLTAETEYEVKEAVAGVLGCALSRSREQSFLQAGHGHAITPRAGTCLDVREVD